jgi:hypothetical protein
MATSVAFLAQSPAAWGSKGLSHGDAFFRVALSEGGIIRRRG